MFCVYILFVSWREKIIESGDAQGDTEAMKNWKVELTTGENFLTKVKIQRGIFQREALSLLLFVMAIT